MSEFLVKNLLINMSLVPTNKLFKSPLGLIFKCCGIARAMPVIINKVDVFIDFHIYAILEFDILIGYLVEKLFKEKSSHGGLDEKFGKTAFVTPIPCPESPMVKHNPNHNPFEQVKFISSFISPKHAYETERIPPTSLERKPCTFGHKPVVLNSDQGSTLILHERFCAMDMPKAPTMETEKDSTIEHESFSFKTTHVSHSFLESLGFIVLSTTCFNGEDNYPSLLDCKLFKRMVVDIFVYHKYCRSRSCNAAPTLQLEHYC